MKTFNQINMDGMLYNYKLEIVDTQKGEAISGDVTVQVDAEGTTATLRYFAYPTYNNGKENRTFGILKDMLDGKYKTVTENGDDADWIALSGSIDSSYFMPQGQNDIEEMACAQKARGSFINANQKKQYRNSWKLDMLITDIQMVDADEEKGLDAYLKVNGYWIDDYRDLIKFVKLQARTEAAMAYISGLEASQNHPYYVNVRGGMAKVDRVVVRKNAFGEDEKEIYSSTCWQIGAMDPEPYDFYDEAIMGEAKYKELKDNLEEHKKEAFKKSQEESDNGLTF